MMTNQKAFFFIFSEGGRFFILLSVSQTDVTTMTDII